MEFSPADIAGFQVDNSEMDRHLQKAVSKATSTWQKFGTLLRNRPEIVNCLNNPVKFEIQLLSSASAWI